MTLHGACAHALRGGANRRSAAWSGRRAAARSPPPAPRSSPLSAATRPSAAAAAGRCPGERVAWAAPCSAGRCWRSPRARRPRAPRTGRARSRPRPGLMSASLRRGRARLPRARGCCREARALLNLPPVGRLARPWRRSPQR
jgi:hypothetical protein